MSKDRTDHPFNQLAPLNKSSNKFPGAGIIVDGLESDRTETHPTQHKKPQTLQNDGRNQLDFGDPTAALKEVGTYGDREYMCAFFPFIIRREVS